MDVVGDQIEALDAAGAGDGKLDLELCADVALLVGDWVAVVGWVGETKRASILGLKGKGCDAGFAAGSATEGLGSTD